MPHLSERFGAALSVLAGHGQIKARLSRAFDEHLKDIDDSALPKDVQKTFSSLRSRMTCIDPLNGEGRVCASVRKMSVFEADECAHIVVDLYAVLLQCEEAIEAPDTNRGKAGDVPAVLLKSV